MLVHVDGEIVFANAAALQMFRADPGSDFVGRPILETVHPEERGPLQTSIDASLDGDSADFFEARRVRRDGTVFLGEGRFRTINWKGSSGVLVVMRDVTERVAAQNAMLENEDRYRQIVDLSPNAILVHVDENIVFANPAAVSIFGATEVHDLVGRRMIEFVPLRGRPHALQRRQKVAIDGVVPL